MFAVITNPPDSGYCLETGTTGAGGDLLAAALGAGLRLCYWRFGVFHILSFFISSVYHL